MPVTRPAVERLVERGWYDQPPERPRRLRSARGGRPVAVGAGPLPRRARHRRAAPRGRRAHRPRRPRAARRGARGGGEARMKPRARAGTRGRCSGRRSALLVVFFVAAHRRRRRREPLLVGPAHAAAVRRHGQLPRARRARRAARTSALRTLGYSVLVVTGTMTLGLGLALLLDRPGRFFGFVRASVFSAYVVSWVAVALLWMWMLDGNSGVVGKLAARRRRSRGVAAGRSALGAARRSPSSASGSSPGTR